jgi:hypothetical protein
LNSTGALCSRCPLGPSAAAARHVEHQAKQLPADLPDRRLAAGDRAGVEVHQVVARA